MIIKSYPLSMGYFTYRLFRDVPLESLVHKLQANLALYEPNTVGQRIQITAMQGDGCSALLLGCLNRDDAVLQPIGFQFGCVWMDVRYQDGDWWDLSVYEGAEHRVSHNVNPWADDLRVDYNQTHVDDRINLVCALWPRQGDALRPYLLPCRVPTRWFGRTRFVPRQGKAYATDGFDYGDADQIHDFIARFGITPQSRQLIISASA